MFTGNYQFVLKVTNLTTVAKNWKKTTNPQKLRIKQNESKWFSYLYNRMIIVGLSSHDDKNLTDVKRNLIKRSK